jgi:hypothetical protein
MKLARLDFCLLLVAPVAAGAAFADSTSSTSASGAAVAIPIEHAGDLHSSGDVAIVGPLVGVLDGSEPLRKAVADAT